MICENCGARTNGDSPFCLTCGFRLDTTISTQVEVKAPTRRRAHTGLWILSLILLAVILLLGILGVGALGVYHGLQERAQLTREAAEEHYALGVAHLEAGEIELAIAEFEFALYLVPDYQAANEKLREAQSSLQTKATPTSEVRSQAIDLLYDQALELYRAGKWDEAVVKLDQVRSVDPDFQHGEVEDMLFTSLYNQGLRLVNQDRLEEALRYFDRALEINPADQDTAIQRRLAALYLTAISYWGADWEKTIASFTTLYNTNPDYLDTTDRLQEAHVSYGDVLARRYEWCAAKQQYASAVRVKFSQEAENKRISANWLCLTSTPTPVITTTETITQQIVGLPVGKLAFSIYNQKTQTYDVFVVHAEDLRWVKMADAADQPSFRPDGGRLAFRRLNDDEPGLCTKNIEGNDEICIHPSPGAAWPTWSPDGMRIAYVLPDEEADYEDAWAIHAFNADGSGEAQLVAKGRFPAWGADGWFAYNGCDDSGENCGIHVLREGMTFPLQLTGSSQDLALAFSPDGRELAYMSNVGRNWNIYVVTVPEGQVRQLTRNAADDGLPVWSPDGEHIAFISDRDGEWGIYLMNPNGSEQRKILELGTEHPNWVEETLSWSH
ncbi:MAG: tetratricopeptide repeat protein [Chloroflexota bacterium]|nr:tetratricopeptide repeat protein [Chloroflexota bacterium]